MQRCNLDNATGYSMDAELTFLRRNAFLHEQNRLPFHITR